MAGTEPRWPPSPPLPFRTIPLSSPTPSDPPVGPQATSATTRETPAFGWSAYAERVNGRFAMLGFAAVVVIELLSHDTFLHWAGLVP